MSEAEHIADALEGMLVNPDSGWFTVFPDAVACLTAEQAAKEPAKGFNSVWKVVNHMAYWQEYFRRRMTDDKFDPKSMGDDWQAIPDPKDDVAWQEAVKKVIDANKKLVKLTLSYSDKQLGESFQEGKPKRYQYLLGELSHNSYHICEIITIRHMLGLWLERT